MALHDYACPGCGAVLRDQYRSVAEGATFQPPVCVPCDRDMEWMPQVGRMDAGSGSSFVAFDTDLSQPDGSTQRVHVGSLHQLRRIERESEQRARNGEGQPLVWRDYSQDRSNRDRHTLMPVDPGTQARLDIEAERTRLRSRGIVGGKTTLTETAAHEVAYGPGVSDQTTSAL